MGRQHVEGLSDRVTGETHRGAPDGCVSLWEISIPGRGNSTGKGPEMGRHSVCFEDCNRRGWGGGAQRGKTEHGEFVWLEDPGES